MDPNKLKFQLINTRSLIQDTRKKELQDLIYKHNTDIVLINETALKPRNYFGINKYNLIRNDRLIERGGGTMILFRDTFQHSQFFINKQFHSFEFSAMILKCINNIKIVIITIYKSRHLLNTTELNESLSAAKNISHLIVMAGDYNSHNVKWGCKSTNSEGRKLEDWAE